MKSQSNGQLPTIQTGVAVCGPNGGYFFIYKHNRTVLSLKLVRPKKFKQIVSSLKMVMAVRASAARHARLLRVPRTAGPCGTAGTQTRPPGRFLRIRSLPLRGEGTMLRQVTWRALLATGSRYPPSLHPQCSWIGRRGSLPAKWCPLVPPTLPPPGRDGTSLSSREEVE